jgi:hypothetical protein
VTCLLSLLLQIGMYVVNVLNVLRGLCLCVCMCICVYVVFCPVCNTSCLKLKLILSFSLPLSLSLCFLYVLRKFKHGVPKMSSKSSIGCRFSIIAWGRRRSLNRNNCGSDEDINDRPIEQGVPLSKVSSHHHQQPTSSGSGREVIIRHDLKNIVYNQTGETYSEDKKSALVSVDVNPVRLVENLIKSKTSC